MRAINENFLGQKFYRMTIIGYERLSGDKMWWYCLCECGTAKKVRPSNLRSGSIQSCGCQRLEKSRTRRYFTHGMTGTPEFDAWIGMKQRVKTSGYLELGVRVCNEWFNSFEAFYAHVGLRPSPFHSIDRINNNDDYKPGNVRWATATEQQRNKRDNHLITIDGETRCVGEWRKLAGLSKGTIYGRIKRGWTGRRLLEPVSNPCRKGPRIPTRLYTRATVKGLDVTGLLIEEKQ